MLIQPISLYLKQAFELLCFTHSYVDPFNHVYYLLLISTMLLSEGIYLWKLSMNAKSLFRWAYGFCYISSVLKRLHSKASIVYSLFSDQELRFATTNYSLLCASFYVIPFTYCKSILCKGKLLSIITCALVNVMLLVRILIIDTSLHKPVVMFTEFSFRLGTSKI
jgi:hypothetical protein